MKEEVLLSLCIPTNGVIEWVIPVLESIYSDKPNMELFEVVITDNGNNSVFEAKMHEYERTYSNLVYKKTDAVMFYNQIEAFKLARGKLIKFINHRMIVLSGTIDYLIKFVQENIEVQPVVYFSNGELHLSPIQKKCDTFNEFVRTLSYWSSWSAGTAIWKKDFEKMDLNKNFNSLFPHTDIVFFNRKSKKYIVDDSILVRELPTDSSKKGTYDLFYAFAVEYLSVIKELCLDGDISYNTYKYVKKKNSYFVSGLYLDYIIKKKPCSYNLDGYNSAASVYYSDLEIRVKAAIIAIKSMGYKLKQVLK